MLARIQSYSNDLVQMGRGLLQRCYGSILREVSEETHDEAPFDAKVQIAVHQCTMQPIDHHVKGNSPVRVGLGVKEYLGHIDIVDAGLAEILVHQVIEILLLQQDRAGLVVQVKKILQVLENQEENRKFLKL